MAMYVFMLMITGKAFDPENVRRLVCFLGLMVSGIKMTKQESFKKTVEGNMGIQREFFESVR